MSIRILITKSNLWGLFDYRKKITSRWLTKKLKLYHNTTWFLTTRVCVIIYLIENCRYIKS